MRNYLNTLLLEGALDSIAGLSTDHSLQVENNIGDPEDPLGPFGPGEEGESSPDPLFGVGAFGPSSSNPNNELIYASAHLFNLRVPVVEEDCGTLLGDTLSVNTRLEGKIELETGLPFTRERIVSLITAGTSSVSVRTLNSCISRGGVCQHCFTASRPAVETPEVGSFVTVSPEVVMDIASYPLLAGATSIPVEYDALEYDFIYVYENGTFLPTSHYGSLGKSILINNPPSTDTVWTVKFISVSNLLFYHWLTHTYSGSLLGTKPLFMLPLPLRENLYREFLNEEEIQQIINQLNKSAIASEDTVQYIPKIRDPLERAVFSILLGSLVLQ